MKQRFCLMALLSIAVAFTSCKKDDEPDPIPEVVGKWEVDYGVTSGFPSNVIQNGLKLDPYDKIYWELIAGLDPFPLSTIHITNNNNVFVNVYKPGTLAFTYTGKWEYTSPNLVLKYDEAGITDETMVYSVQDGLEQLAINEPQRDSTGAVIGTIQWVYHK